MTKSNLFVLALLWSSALSTLAKEHKLENDFVAFTFDTSGDLTALTDKKSGVNAVGDASGSIPLWEIKLVDKVGELDVNQLNDADVQFLRKESHKLSLLTLSWNDINVLRNEQVISNVNVTLKVSLRDTASISEWEVSLVSNSGDQIGVWEATISLPLSIASGSDGELFFPSGFGHTFSDPAVSTGGNYASTYPGGMASMQFMALGSTTAKSAAYFAAMDPAGQGKGIQYSTFASAQSSAPTPLLRSARKAKKEASPVRKWRPHAKPSAAAISFTIYPPNAGVPMERGATWTAPYSLAVGMLPDVSDNEGRPLWSEAASTYRQWALSNAAWVKQGTLLERSKRADEPPMPDWYMSNTLWINTHWQCHDIFNATGGDPAFVLDNTLAVAERLWTPLDKSAPAPPRSMALHWYEWQQGPDPDPAARYLFDTHYPDYFPSRTDFKAAVAGLRKNNITTFPYINGRISDVNSISYAADNGEAYCSKQAPAKLVNAADPQDLQSYVETYGSNATFCVTNPFTGYWQQKLADTVRELVKDYGVPGVYIDQIGSAIPKMCWDASHHHTLGGGDFWTTGYQAMMDAISASLYNTSISTTAAAPSTTSATATPAVAEGAHLHRTTAVTATAATAKAPTAKVGYPMVTEDNAEPYMGMVQGFLTLDAMKLSLAQAPSPDMPAAGRMSPAYPMIYGGYYVGFGAIWSRADFGDHDWWCSKLAAGLVTGTQLGWFSLAGIADDAEDSCGPMGVGDLFMDPASDELVTFLQLLSATRLAAAPHLTYGHLMRPPVLNPAPAVQLFTSSFDGSKLAYDTVLVQAWQLEGSVLLIVVNAVDKAYEGEVTVRPADWSLVPESVAEMVIVDRATNARVSASTRAMEGGKLAVPVKVGPRSVLLLEFKHL